MDSRDLVARPAEPALESPQDDSLLFQLPVELLEHIFELVYHCRGPGDHIPITNAHVDTLLSRSARRPICKGLRAIQEHYLYRTVEVTSIQTLALLARTLVNDPRQRGALVNRLFLGRFLCNDWTHDVYDMAAMALRHGGPCDLVTPGAAACLLAGIFGEMSRLESLRLYFPYRDPSDYDLALLGIIFNGSRTPIHLQTVETIGLYVGGDLLDDLNPDQSDAWIRQLNRFGRLKKLIVFSLFTTSAALSRSSARLYLKQLSTLRILYPKCLRTPIRDLAPNLEQLKMTLDDTDGPALRYMVAHAPPSLVVLYIEVWHDDMFEALDDLLPIFPLLRSLFLFGKCYDPDRLPSSIGHLDNLKHLGLDWSETLSDHVLLDLVTGPSRPKSLRTISVRHGEAVYGPTLREKGGALPRDDERDESGVWKGWTAPTWPEGCTKAGLAGAVRCGRANGIKVRGSAVRALKWHGKYVAERDEIARRRGLEEGDWTDARRFLGDEVVESLIEERRAAAA
ncbi:hypothetical protein JCM9279_005319 [Rhodotorula babjevae]